MNETPSIRLEFSTIERLSRCWNSVHRGLLLVALGLLGPILALLILALPLAIRVAGIASGQTITSARSNVTLPVVTVSISLLGTVLVFIGRCGCCASPAGVASGFAIRASCVATFLLIVSGCAIAYYTIFEGATEQIAGRVVFHFTVGSLAALVVAEGCFLAFLRAVAVKVENQKLQDRVVAFGVVVGLGVIATFVLMFSAVVSLDAPFTITQGRTREDLVLFVQVSVVAVLLTLIGLGWYLALVWRAYQIVGSSLKPATAHSPEAAMFDDPVPAHFQTALPNTTNIQDDDFERYFMEEAGQKDWPNPPA